MLNKTLDYFLSGLVYKTTPNTDSEIVENVFAFVKCAYLLGVLSPFSGVSECARQKYDFLCFNLYVSF